MATTKDGIRSCTETDCKRNANALCLHCNTYVCNKHYFEHVQKTNEELLLIVDQLNTIGDHFQQLNVNNLSKQAVEQLEQWRAIGHNRIEEVYYTKKESVMRMIQTKLEDERSRFIKVKSLLSQCLDQNDTSQPQIEQFKQQIKELETSYFDLNRSDLIFVDAKPLEIESDSLTIQLRQSNELAKNDSLLRPEHQFQLNQWIGVPEQRWRLVYKAKRDGFAPKDFHRCADNQGPTVVIIQTNDGWLFGGYTSKSWTSQTAYVEDNNQPFIFTLLNPHKILPTKYEISPEKTHQAVLHGPVFGPTFGYTDFCVYERSEDNMTVIFEFPSSYIDSTGKGVYTFANTSSCQASDIEVYSLS